MAAERADEVGALENDGSYGPRLSSRQSFRQRSVRKGASFRYAHIHRIILITVIIIIIIIVININITVITTVPASSRQSFRQCPVRKGASFRYARYY